MGREDGKRDLDAGFLLEEFGVLAYDIVDPAIRSHDRDLPRLPLGRLGGLPGAARREDQREAEKNEENGGLHVTIIPRVSGDPTPREAPHGKPFPRRQWL